MAIYVDSNVFLYPVLYDPKEVPRAKRAERMLLQIAEGKINASTSVLTWDEVTWVTMRLIDYNSAKVQGESFLRLPNLRLLSVDIYVTSKAQELLEKWRLRPRDSIHAATALRNGIRKIMSFDPHFDVIKGLSRIEP